MPDELPTEAASASQSIPNGARVRHKSGSGPTMIAIVDPAQGVSAGQPKTICQWFDQQHQLQTFAIPAVALVQIDQPARFASSAIHLSEEGRAAQAEQMREPVMAAMAEQEARELVASPLVDPEGELFGEPMQSAWRAVSEGIEAGADHPAIARSVLAVVADWQKGQG